VDLNGNIKMKWIKKQMLNLTLAISNVEKNALNQEGIDGGIETGKYQRLNQNSLMDALLRGEMNDEVEKLRWRIYKTSSAIKNYGTKVVGYTIDGHPITKITYVGDEERLAKIKKEPSDEYELIMVVDNTNVSASVFSSLNLDIDEYDEPIDSKTTNIINKDDAPKGFTIDVDDEINNGSNIELGDDEIKTIGEVKDNKVELNLPISITREHRPKFELENYTKKLHVKEINDKEFLLEFFISKYPNQFDKKSDFFLSDIKKLISQPKRYNSIIDINTVSFVTNNTVGVPDFLEFEYNVQKFDKIVEFNEFYVVKFISEVTIEAKSIIDKFRNEELDEKYKNKEKR
jgi:hypothetical protein